MPKINRIRPEFVEYAPKQLDEGVLYISCQNVTMIHLCCCGCGSKVVMPISPTGWELRFNGISVSLTPSVGNWNLNCQSHYWIRNNRIQWARRLSKTEIADCFSSNERLRKAYYSGRYDPDGVSSHGEPIDHIDSGTEIKTGLWQRLKHWLF